ncbi:MAG TPA: DUF2029 domain-containing protein [Anaerolineae bacterium]|nr:DUF2029 domain-containing protein [Anaerolineae bacterium]
MKMRPHLRLLIGGSILLVLFVVNVIVTHDGLTEPHPGHNDFLTVWEAGRSFWREGLDPYSEAVTANIQSSIYGRGAEGDEFPNAFAYPFYALWVMLPLVFTDFAWASAIYMALSEACFILSLILLLDLFRWKPPAWLFALLALWSLLQYFAARGLVLGQVSNVVYLMQVVVLWALARRRDGLAGVVLALSTLKPQMGFLLIPFLLLWGVRRRRTSFVAAFTGFWTILLLSSFLLQPDWLRGWIGQLRTYPQYTVIGSPTHIVMQDWLALGATGEWIANLALWGLLLWAWMGVLLAGRAERHDWTIMLTLTITHLSALRTATPHFVIFTIPLVFYLREAGKKGHGFWIAAILVGTLAIFWAQFLLTVKGRFEHASMYVVLPVAMLILLWFTRRLWWESSSVMGDEVAEDIAVAA